MTLGETKTRATRAANGKANSEAAPAASEFQAINELENESVDKLADEFTSKNGIIFKIKKVPNMLIADANRKIVFPRVPTVFIEDKGREEENPNDPDYMRDLREAQTRQGMMGVNTYISFGTEVKHIPEGMVDYLSQEWSEDIEEITGLEIPKKGKGRYCAWVKYYALDDEDMTDLNIQIARFSGSIPERDVTDAEDSFRDNEEGAPDSGVPSN